MKVTGPARIAIYLKCAELLFDKDKYNSSLNGKVGNAAHPARYCANHAFASYVAEMAEAMIFYLEHPPSERQNTSGNRSSRC
jgi:hypothetical protein